jgi:putative glutamine amidotransferase
VDQRYGEIVRPLIALPMRYTETADSWRVAAHAVGLTYLQAIVRAGGSPVAVPPLGDTIADLEILLSRFDGICLPGGPDLNPNRYTTDEAHPTVYGVDDAHDELDLAMAAAAVNLNVPLLAICRGHQVLNVALGGTLVQHIGDEEAERHRFKMHPVQLDGSSRASRSMGSTMPIGHSVHHQAIDQVGANLDVVGHADDGMIEAVEMAGRWLVSVQWHPEDTASDDAEQQRLFDAFVEACR